ncbi:unnamed protein product [Boreogadus saida]
MKPILRPGDEQRSASSGARAAEHEQLKATHTAAGWDPIRQSEPPLGWEGGSSRRTPAAGQTPAAARRPLCRLLWSDEHEEEEEEGAGTPTLLLREPLRRDVSLAGGGPASPALLGETQGPGGGQPSAAYQLNEKPRGARAPKPEDIVRFCPRPRGR